MMYSTRYKSHHDASRALKTCFEQTIDKESYVYDILQQSADKKRVLYIHVPFCNKICSFCPFHRVDQLNRNEYHHYIIQKLNALKGFPYMQKEFSAINFGGGTPTALKPKQMAAILQALKENLHYSPDIEISVESSITELTDEMIQVLQEGGVNRLSIGVQTFQDSTRAMLNRRGSGKQAIEKIKEVIRRGFTNTSIDLIYNYPGQQFSDLQKDLDIIKSLDLAGISFYSLMIHEKTPLAKKLTDQQRKQMQDLDHEKALFDQIVAELRPEGYQFLELTKLVRKQKDRYAYMDIRHTRGCCVAIGHLAGGNIENYIYHNSIAYPEFSTIPISKMGRVVKDRYFLLDELIYKLQKTSIDLQEYSALLQIDLKDLWKELLVKLEKEQLIRCNENGFSLTDDGIFFGNNIIADLIQLIINKHH